MRISMGRTRRSMWGRNSMPVDGRRLMSRIGMGSNVLVSRFLEGTGDVNNDPIYPVGVSALGVSI